MKKQVRAVALGASLLLAGTAFAQTSPAQVPPPPPSEATPPPPPPGTVPPDTAAPGTLPASQPPTTDPMTTQAPDPSMPPPAANAPPPPAGGMESGSASSASMSTPQGQVTVNSGPAQAKPAGPAPDWATLSGGKASITAEQASAYPLLANDFQYADSNRDGKISKAEYQKWLTHSGAGN